MCAKCYHTIYAPAKLKNHIVTEETKEKIRRSKYHKNLKGKKNPNYKHGKTSLADKIRQTEQYVIWRNKVYQKDNYTCQLCKEHGRKLHAHHKLPLINLILFFNLKTVAQASKCKVLWDPRWGITLCRKCHPKIENGGIE